MSSIKTFHSHKLQKYADKMYRHPRVQDYIWAGSTLTLALGDANPTVYVSDTCGVETAGQIWCDADQIDIELSSWILVDEKLTQSVIRHELAHALVFLCELEGSSHGRGFTQALKLISPRLFRRDRHWHDTLAVYTERKKHHPKTQFRQA